MSWIRMIEEAEADEDLKAAYEKVGRARGRVANILKIHSVQSRTMLAHLDLYRQIMFGRSELSRAEREMLAVVVSATNHCHY